MVTAEFHQERQRLLCLMKSAPDHYELAFSSAEHAGYLRGLRDSGAIGGAAHDLYQSEAEEVVDAAIQRLTSDLTAEAA
jgi:hypothetical protein